MRRRAFERLARQILQELPADFKQRLHNVEFIVEDWPSAEELREMDVENPYELLGAYFGVPLTARGDHYNLTEPDRIVLYQGPIESRCSRGNSRELRRELKRTILHEVAHYFGIDDEQLTAMGRE